VGYWWGSGDDRYDRMHEMLRSQGIIPRSQKPTGTIPAWRTELGHDMSVHHVDGIGWSFNALHMGDPSGAGIEVPLGRDDETAALRVGEELRNRETLGHLRDQYLRASLNNDPTGNDHQSRRVPCSTGGWNRLDHYRD
jgi:hypothetical protein